MANLNVPGISISQFQSVLLTMMKSQMPCFLHGKPGVGKSRAIQDFCDEHGYGLTVEMLAQMQPTDIRGVLAVDVKKREAFWAIPDRLPSEANMKRDKNGNLLPHILFLDELTAASPDIQVAAYQLILNRQVGPYKLPDNVYVVAAGNSVEDGAIAYEMGTALADRLVHFNIQVSTESWLEWAPKAGIHPWVIGFIKTEPTYLDGSMLPSNNSLVRPTPRGWEYVSNMLYVCDANEVLKLVVPGKVGDAAAAQFNVIVEQMGKLASIEEFFKNADNENAIHKIAPRTKETLYGLVYSLASYADSVKKISQAMLVMEHVASIDDGLYRREAQFLSIDMLLQKAFKEGWGIEVVKTPGFKAIQYHIQEMQELKSWDTAFSAQTQDIQAMQAA